ncbi:Uncharacterised protein [Acinetobacter baumannii]|nr:Uncharacterised protein [Acinetobacter baumannii]
MTRETVEVATPAFLATSFTVIAIFATPFLVIIEG